MKISRTLLVLLTLFNLHLAAERSIGLLVSHYFRGEIALANRMQTACNHLGWSADVIHPKDYKYLRHNTYDFVIALVPDSPRVKTCKNYLAIFHPSHHYFKKLGVLSKKYRLYDGYLLTYQPDKSSIISPYINWLPAAAKMPHKIVDPSHLFHVGALWGDRYSSEKFKTCFKLLDQAPYMRLYGSPSLKHSYKNSYQGFVPYEGQGLHTLAQDAGISLVLHSSDHNKHDLPSGRIFEAAAASTVIICDQNAFVQKHFGDSVLYIDTTGDGESIYCQIDDMMEWICANKEQALAKAKKAHDIFTKHFSLEDQLLKLEEFHDQIMSQDQLKD